MKKNKLVKHFHEKNFVKIITDEKSCNEEFNGFIIGLSSHFVLSQEIMEWHNDGVRIYPLERILKCETNDHMGVSKQVLEWNGVEISNQYDWLNLDSYESLFRSIKKKRKTILIDLLGGVEVGEVRFTTENNVILKSLDTNGRWLSEVSSVSFDDINTICIDDEYSSVLRRYADTIKQEIPKKDARIIMLQLQPELDGRFSKNDFVEHLRMCDLKVKQEKAKLDQKYFNFFFETDNHYRIWGDLKLKLLDDDKMGEWIKKVSLIVCEGDFGWDDYFLLWSFGKKDEELDEI